MYRIVLPQLPAGLADATVLRWRVSPGQPVRAGEVLLELQADRQGIEVTADRDAVLAEILAHPGVTLQTGSELARMDENARADSSQPTPAAGPSEPPKPKPSKEKPMTTPKGNVIPVLMPKAGNTMEEGTIIAWKVKPGDRIEAGDVIFEVETDKAAVEIEAPDSGRLARIVAEEGDVIPVLEPVAYLAESDEDVDAYIAQQGGEQAEAAETPAQAAPAPSEARGKAAAPATPQPTTADETGRVKASPAARKTAEQRGVDLASVGTGSGPGGRILSTDVPSAGAPAAAAPQPSSAPAAGREKMTSMRAAIGKALQQSKQTIPHFYIEMTIDADGLMNFYRLAKAQYPLSVNDIIVKACGKALMEFPAFRSRIEGDELLTMPSANIGVAVGTDRGLTVPVVQGVEGRKLADLAAETKRLAQAARDGKLEGVGTGVFTISNLGMFGIDRFSAIINPPEAAILAVGAVREEVIVAGGTMRPGRKMTVTLSCDHRVVDGLVAAKFLNRLKQLLEAPNLME